MKVTDIKIEEFDYPLPDEQIAKHPLAERDTCRLLVRTAAGAGVWEFDSKIICK